MKNGSFKLIPSREMLEMWPKDLINFLENKIVFAMPQQSNASAVGQLALNIVGLPDEIIGNSFVNFFLFIVNN